MQPAAAATTLPLPSREAAVLRGHTGHVQCVRWNSTGMYCLSGGNDKTIRLWNPEKGTLVKTYKGHSYEILDLDVIGDNSQIVSVGEDKQPFLWDVTQGKIIRRYRGHGGRIHCVRFFSDTVFVTGSFDRTVKVWDLRSNSIDPIQTMEEARDGVMSVSVTPSEIIAGSVDGCVRRYDIRGGALVTDTIGAPVVSVTQSHDGNCIVVSTLDSTVRLFDKSNGELLASYRGHANQKYKVDSALTNNDAYVISGSEDGSVCFWDLVEASMAHRLRGHAGAVTGLATGPKDVNGVTPLLTSSTDGTVPGQVARVAYRNVAVESIKSAAVFAVPGVMDGFSSALKLTGLDDFIAPSQVCIKPLEVPKASTKRSIISMEEDGKYIETLETGERKELTTAKLTLNDCLACSGCVTTAETMLIQAQSVAEFFFNLKRPDGRTFVVSVSPQVRASIAARYNISAIETHQRLISLLTSWGVHHVVDTSFSRDFSLIEISAELIERVKRSRAGEKGTTPLIASACPGWICYAEKTHGDFVLPYISTSKSPQQVMGTLVKQYFAKQIGVSHASIYHTSLMPCFDKKLEAARDDFKDPVHGRDVDCVLTSVELQQALEEQRIDFLSLPMAPLPKLCVSCSLLQCSQLGVAGGSGGYAETVLRQAALVLHNQTLGEIQWRQGRSPDVKEASLEIDGQRVLTVALVYGFKNIQNLIRKLKTGSTGYDFVEIMACPSGCVNGGGQLRPVAPETAKDLIKRVDSTYHAQLQPTSPFNNLVVNELYANWVKGTPYSAEAKRLLHTQYHAREKMGGNKLTIQW